MEELPMMSSEVSKYDEIRKVILSLLLSRKNAMPVATLDQDYREMEGEHIPWRKFGYANLIAFLKSMPQHFEVEQHNSCYYVRGIASEKSKHVSSLVARQKCDMKTKKPRFHQSHQSSSRYALYMQRQRIRIPAEQLHLIMQRIKKCPNGLSIQNIMIILQKQLPQVVLSVQDVREQLRELSHQLILDGEMIYPVLPNDDLQYLKNYQRLSAPAAQTRSTYHDDNQTKICVAGDEDCMEGYNSNQNDYLEVNYRSNKYPTQLTNERLPANFVQNTNCKQMKAFKNNNYDDNNKKTDEYIIANNYNNDSNDKASDNRCIDISTLINDRTKSRLEQLMQKHTEGIWCAELPDKYLNEYKVHLNYTELGFSSVREYVSYLPNIFYMTRVNTTDDFILFSADKRPRISNQEKSSQTTKSVETRTNFDKWDNKHNSMQTQYNDDDEAIPTNISPNIISKFVPDDVMNYNDTVNFISVTDLQCKKHLKVYIVEVFTPSFFWVHLRENRKPLHLFMDDLQYFYENNSHLYTIPKVALNKGLNCACLFSCRWHRAIIKSVKSDFRVTVMFYDYGTLKTYPPEEIYYLHKQFAYLPAQGIPCGLYNVKPCVGDRWKKSVTDQFMDKISDNLLVATIFSVDSVHNSMMVTLTDTSEDEHMNVNDWLVHQNLAQRGKLDNAVDMTNLMKYVLNSVGQLPMYCYADENLVADCCSKTISTEQMLHKIPLVLPEQTCLCRSNQQQQLSERGFLPLDSVNVYSSENASFLNKIVTTTNPFLDDQTSDVISIDTVKHIFGRIWKENMQLQIKFSKIFHNLLEHSSVRRSTVESYMMKQYQINNILKNIEKLTIDDGSISNITDLINETTSHEINSKSKTSFHSNDVMHASSNLFDVDRSTNQTVFLNSIDRDLDDIKKFQKNLNQSADEFDPYVQISSTLAGNPIPIHSNDETATSSFFQKIDHEIKNVSSMESVFPEIFRSSSKSSSFSGFNSIPDLYNNVHKETNPFRVSTIEKIQIPETQSEQRTNDNSSNSGYLSRIKSTQNYTSNVESANVCSKTDVFLPTTQDMRDIDNDDYMVRTVYNTDSVIYNTQEKDANANTMQDAFYNNVDNVRTKSFMIEQCNKELSPQFANDMAAYASFKHEDSTHIDEGYVTRPSTIYNLQNLPLTISDEQKHHQKDIVNKLPNVLTKPWEKIEIPEHQIDTKFEKDMFSRIYSNNNSITNQQKRISTSVNVSSRSNCDNKVFTAQDLNSVNELDYFSQSNDDEKLMDDRCKYKSENIISKENEISIQENLSNAVSNFSFKNCFVFHKIDIIKGVTFIFHIEDNGWILTHEFMKTFTNYKLYSCLMDAINRINIKVLLKEIKRTQYPMEFLQLDRYSLAVPRDEKNCITSIHLISLQTALLLLDKLNIVSHKEIDNVLKKNEFLGNSVLLTKMWLLILTYQHLMQEHRNDRV